MLEIRNKAKSSLLKFYMLQDFEYGRGSGDFSQHLKARVILFNRALKELKVDLPMDFLISLKKMNRRIERCCLLFKTSDRTLQALYDLAYLGQYIRKVSPVLLPLQDFTRGLLNLGFDLDHVFLVDYQLKAGRIVEISGFHSDYLGEISEVGNSDFNRLKINKIGVRLKGIEEAYLVLDDKRSCKKTLFPIDWDWLKCLNGALDALENILEEETLWSKTGELIIFGLTEEKIALRMVIDVRHGNVKTFYPNIKLTKKYTGAGRNNVVYSA